MLSSYRGVRCMSSRTVKMLLINDTAPFLGQPGDIVTVKPGYARNWLYPNKVAVYAVPNKLEQYAQLVEIGRKRLMNKKQQAALGKGAKEKKQQEEEFNMLRTARTKIAAKILAKRIKMNFSEQTLREVIEGTPVGEAETPAEEVKEAQESLALESKEKLEKLELTFARESSPATGTLFGSVTAEDIVKLVNEKTEEGFLSVSLIDPSLQKQALKSLGEHKVVVNLSKTVSASLKVFVVSPDPDLAVPGHSPKENK